MKQIDLNNGASVFRRLQDIKNLIKHIELTSNNINYFYDTLMLLKQEYNNLFPIYKKWEQDVILGLKENSSELLELNNIWENTIGDGL